jgi:tRNA(Arg) A34 adenosine deaminase TadA
MERPASAFRFYLTILAVLIFVMQRTNRMLSRRAFGTLMGAASCVGDAAASSVPAPTVDLDAISLAAHEAAMRLAIAAAKANPFYPFGAVIVGPDDRAVLAEGVNNTKTNPTPTGRSPRSTTMSRHGNQGWADGILYTTGEPCPMCMSAIVWASIGGVVYGSSITTLAEAGIAQILIGASAVREAAPWYRGQIMGGVLRAETDALFHNRRRT